ncbi:MAG TPA: MFS transporter [Burkholderiales bacterium]|nr:MFS transporter [Burkholderiales bacterium]
MTHTTQIERGEAGDANSAMRSAQSSIPNPQSYSRSAQLFLNFGHAIDHLLMLIYPTVVIAMAPEFGKDYAEMLPLSLGGFITFGACSLPAGWLADRWTRHGMIVLFFIGMGASSVLTGFSQTTWHIALGLTLIGVFGAIYHPVGVAMLVSGRDKVGRVLGTNGVFGNLGVAFAALIAGALAYWVGWRAAFIVPGILSILIGIAFAIAIPSGFGIVKGPGARRGNTFPRGFLAHVFVVLVISTICGGVIFNSTTIAMPKVFDERLQALVSTTLGIGTLVAAVYTVAAFAQLCVGLWIDRHSIKSVFVPVVALQVPLLLLAGTAENYAMLMIALAMMFFVFGQVPINDAMVAAYTDERWRARAYAVRYVVSFVGSAASVPLVAYAHRAAGDFKPLFLILAALAAIMLAAAVTLPGIKRAPVRA